MKTWQELYSEGERMGWESVIKEQAQMYWHDLINVLVAPYAKQQLAKMDKGGTK